MTSSGERDETELLVMLELGGMLCAVASANVERVLSVDECQLTPQRDSVEAEAALGTLVSQGKTFAAWDLFRLLGLGAQPATTWLLTAVTTAGGAVPVALRAGPCRAIERARRLGPLPAAAFRERRGAISELFAPRSDSQLTSFACGAMLDCQALLQPTEVEACERWLARASRW